MIKKYLFFFIFHLCLIFQNQAIAANASGTTRGVTFFYLDGVSQDFPWVLDNQYLPTVRAKIDNLLTKYREADVNWIRILVASDHFTLNPSGAYPIPSQSLVNKVNDFMAITRSGLNAGKFKIEIVLIPKQVNSMFVDVAPYSADKLWYKTWLDKLNYSNLGMVMFGGDLSPCLLGPIRCQGEPNADALVTNHGKWIKEMWAWKQSNYPNLSASYEVIGVQAGSNNDPALIKKLAVWMNTNTPSNPIVAASMYVDLPTNSTWQQYLYATLAILDAYHSVSNKPLWIDEFGKSMNTLEPQGVQDQRNAYQGFLGASICWRPNKYPKFAWVAGNDYPYTKGQWYGLTSGFSLDQPMMRDTWSDLKLYYSIQACP
jgi:hypothetical protein